MVRIAGCNPVDYDEISKIYDYSRSEAYPETVDTLRKLLNVTQDSLLLDLGCGTGNYISAFQPTTERVIGIDMSRGMIKQAQDKLGKPLLTQGNVIRLPYKSKTFDGAFSIQVIHHITHKEVFLKEAYRVILGGGNIAIDSCSHAQLRIHWFYHYFPKALEIDIKRIPDTMEIITWLEKAGFLDISVEPCFSDLVVTQETPESYLDEHYRNGISTFTYLKPSEIEKGCKRIREEILTGEAEKVVQSSRRVMLSSIGGSSIIHAKKP